MSELEKVMIERRQLALDHLDDIEWKIEQVECDDYGDVYFKWHAEAYIAGECITDDYFHNEPDSVKLYNYMLEGIKDGSLGDRIADILQQDDNYDRAEKKLSK